MLQIEVRSCALLHVSNGFPSASFSFFCELPLFCYMLRPRVCFVFVAWCLTIAIFLSSFPSFSSFPSSSSFCLPPIFPSFPPSKKASPLQALRVVFVLTSSSVGCLCLVVVFFFLESFVVVFCCLQRTTHNTNTPQQKKKTFCVKSPSLSCRAIGEIC